MSWGFLSRQKASKSVWCYIYQKQSRCNTSNDTGHWQHECKAAQLAKTAEKPNLSCRWKLQSCRFLIRQFTTNFNNSGDCPLSAQWNGSISSLQYWLIDCTNGHIIYTAALLQTGWHFPSLSPVFGTCCFPEAIKKGVEPFTAPAQKTQKHWLYYAIAPFCRIVHCWSAGCLSSVNLYTSLITDRFGKPSAAALAKGHQEQTDHKKHRQVYYALFFVIIIIIKRIP